MNARALNLFCWKAIPPAIGDTATKCVWAPRSNSIVDILHKTPLLSAPGIPSIPIVLA